MDQKITAKNENRDPKVLKAFEVIQQLKSCEPTMGEVCVAHLSFIKVFLVLVLTSVFNFLQVTKATSKYVEQMQKLIDAGKILAAVLSGLADQRGGDLGDGLRTTRSVKEFY